MNYSGFEILWLFFTYSFIGWMLEAAYAAVRQKRLVNRGAITLPFCILYGMVAVFITVFGRELRGVWLFIGSAIIITVFKWIAGYLIERIYHEKWWDYSNRLFNIGGYVSLIDSVILAVLAVVMKTWVNGFLLFLFDSVPQNIQGIIIWILVSLVSVDIAATVLAYHGKEHRFKILHRISKNVSGFTDSLNQKVYKFIDKRIRKAYPQVKDIEEPREEENVFAYGCSIHKLVWLFIIGSFLGDITETIFCRITAGKWMSRSSVVWGPFSIVWGLAIVMATLLLHRYRERPDRNIFLAGTLLGGAYEYICSVFTEIVFGKVFWDYSHLKYNLGGRINLLFCFFWGIAAVAWIKGVYPAISGLIEKVPIKIGKIISYVAIIFMCANMVVSSLALIRSTQRSKDIPATQSWQKLLDEKYDDETLMKIYPNAISKKHIEK